MDGVKTDHIEIFQYYDQYASARDKGDVDAQERWARQLIWEVARHSIGEELVVYPLLEKNLGERGRAMADTDRAEHQVRTRPPGNNAQCLQHPFARNVDMCSL